jgi:hypothetical protein
MRTLTLLCCCLALTCGAALSQGLSPSAGAASEGLYTNLYFGMNYKLPADWTLGYVAVEGPCERECRLLDARAPGDKSRRALTVTAEVMSAASADSVATAGVALEQMGAKKIAPAKEITVAGRKSFRADYRAGILV